MLDRRLLLTAVVVAIVPAFGLTQLIVTRYRGRRQELAGEWSRQAERDLAARPAAAVIEFETALSYGPDRSEDRYLLATALDAVARPAEARAELLSLAADQPASGKINLELARLAAKDDALDDAVRYYHAAIDGVWESGATTARRQARIELARLLMKYGQRARSQAELIALVDELPPDAAILSSVAALLDEAGAPGRALALTRRALELSPHDERAAVLAGEIEFRSGDFRAAYQDLSAIAARAPLLPEAHDMLDVSGRAIALDPYANRLALRSRAARALRARDIASDRLARCTSTPALAARMNSSATVNERALERDPDLIDDVMSGAFEVERLPSGSCEGDTADDRALAMIGRQHGSQPQ